MWLLWINTCKKVSPSVLVNSASRTVAGAVVYLLVGIKVAALILEVCKVKPADTDPRRRRLKSEICIVSSAGSSVISHSFVTGPLSCGCKHTSCEGKGFLPLVHEGTFRVHHTWWFPSQIKTCFPYVVFLFYGWRLFPWCYSKLWSL